MHPMLSSASLKKITTLLLALVIFNLIAMLPTKAAGTVEWSASGQRITTGVTATTDQTGQEMVRTSEGDYIIVWLDSRNTGNYTGTAEEGTLDTDIYAQKIDNQGTIQWTANGEALETSTRGSLISNANLTIVADNAGGAFVGWINDNNQTDQTRLHILHLESDGDIDWTSDVDDATAANASISLLADATTGVFAAWASGTPTSDVLVTHINNLGNIATNWTPGASLNINSTATHNEYDPELVTSGAGGVIVSYQYVSSGNQYELYYKKVSSTGTAGSAITIAASALDEATHKSMSDGSGGIITVFQVSDPADATSKNIYAQRVNSSDSAIWGANGTAISTATGNQTNPVLTTDNNTPTSGAMFAWEDNRSGTLEIYAQKINTNGTVQWAANGLAVSNTGDGVEQHSPAIVTNNGSGAVVAFISNPNDDVDTRIYAQHLSSSGSAHWTAGGILIDDVQAPTERTDTAHILISDGNAGALIAFSGIDNNAPENGYKLFGQHITDSFGAICSEIGSDSFCGRQVITSAILSFYDIPDSFSFDSTSVSGTDQPVFNNAEPVNATGAEDLEDLLVIQDTRESGGFEVQLSAEGDFTDGTNTIAIENLHVVTNTSDNLTNTITAGGVTYENTISDPTVQTIDAPIDAGDNNADVNNITTFTSLIPESQFAANSSIVLMDGSLSASLGRNGKMYQFLDFYLNIPAFQPSGDYAAILTYTLFDDTTP